MDNRKFSLRLLGVVLTITFTIANHSIAQSCNDAWLFQAKKRLDTLLLNYLPESALNFADSIKQQIEKDNLSQCEEAMWIYYNRGEALELHHKFKEALDIYYKLIESTHSINNSELEACCHISIARCMETIGRDSDCKRHLDIANNIIVSNNLKEIEAFLYVRKASYHRIFNTNDSGYYYAKLAVDRSEQFNLSRQAADAYFLIGKLSNHLDSSINNYKRSIKHFLNNQNYKAAAAMAFNILKSYEKNNARRLADQWIDSLGMYLSLIKEYNENYYSLASTYAEERAKQFQNIKKLDSASYYWKLSNNNLKKLGNNTNQLEVSQAEIDFFIRFEKEKSIYLERQSKFQKIALGFLAIGLLFILSVLYNNYLKRNKIEDQQEFILKQNDELNNSLTRQNLLLSEVHHRVKNNLQLVISLLTLQFSKLKNNKDYHFVDEIANKIRSIALIHEMLYNSGEFERIELGSYIKELIGHYWALHTYGLKFEYNLESDTPIYLNLETVMPIGIICTEIISNSLKYARRDDLALRLEFKLSSLENKYVLKYSDNGPAEKVQTNKGGGMGTMLIESMVRQLQAQCSPIIYGTATFNLIFQEKKVSAI